jgi:alpha-glucoside transport system substrate-binding protein
MRAFDRERALSRRTILLGVLGAASTGVLAACAGQQASPTTAPAATKPAADATKPAAGATSAATKPAGTPGATAGATAAATKPAAGTAGATAAATKPAAGATAGATTTTGAATKPAAAGPALKQIGGTVNVLATWGGDEQEAFLAMVKPYEEQTGVTVEYEGTRDLNAVLTTRVQGGNPPDVAGLPGPGPMAQFARDGKLVDLGTVLDTSTIQQQYSEQWLKLAQVEGKQVAIFIKAAVKGLIWHNPKAFQDKGYTIPKTWDETMTLSEKIVGEGAAPWSVGLESGAASGWPGTDWLEDFVLRQSGPDVYMQWADGKVKWTSPEIKQAWEAWGKIVGNEKMVYGGKQFMLATAFGEAANPLFTSPPNAFLHHQANFMTSFIEEGNPNLEPVQGYDFFPFPDINSQYAGAVEVAGDLFGMFNNTPQAQALIQWLASPAAQQIWVQRGGALSANKQVPASAYPDAIAKKAADTMNAAKVLAFDASDLMPEAMNNAFFKAILDFVNNPGGLDGILSNLDSVQADAYKA